jgi:hypothetical protein
MTESPAPYDVSPSTLDERLALARSNQDKLDQILHDLSTIAEGLVQVLQPREPEIDQLAASLAKAQMEIQNAEKDTANDFLNSRYASLAAVMAVCRKPLASNGLSIVQLPRPSVSPGIVELETMLIHESGQYISTVWQMAPPKTDPQGLGSCLTYMRRYMVSAMLGIAQVDDDASRAQPGSDEYERITAKEADAILIEADQLFGADAEAVIARMLAKVFSTSDNIIDRVTDIPAGQADSAITLLKNQHKREQAQKKQKADAKKPQSDDDA